LARKGGTVSFENPLAAQRRAMSTGTRALFGALALIALSPAFAQTCPTGQRPTSAYSPTGVVRTIAVPGNAGGLRSGIFIQPGFQYRMTAVGSIRVGVFGETGTPPEGWVPQGQCGPGCPSQTAYTFSLLYRVGNAGAWELLGTGLASAKLGPRDAAGSELQFGINDTKLSDNNGAHIVTVSEFKLGPTTCVADNPVTPVPSFVGLYKAGTTTKRPPSGGKTQPYQPCAGKTPDGQKQSFQFPLYCSGTFSRHIPVEACTRAEALAEAQTFAGSAALGCVLIP